MWAAHWSRKILTSLQLDDTFAAYCQSADGPTPFTRMRTGAPLEALMPERPDEFAMRRRSESYRDRRVRAGQLT